MGMCYFALCKNSKLFPVLLCACRNDAWMAHVYCHNGRYGDIPSLVHMSCSSTHIDRGSSSDLVSSYIIVHFILHGR